jgi:uncharacterized membrane protein
MATRQTASKSGKRRTTPAASKPATAPPVSKANSSRDSRGKSAAPTKSVPIGTGAQVASNPNTWRAALRWAGGGVALTTLVVSVLGLADSAYLTYEHFTQSASFACPENATVNCVKVTTSPESHLFGIPVAVLGLAFFLFMLAINSPWGWRAPRPAVHWARLGSVVLGIVFVLYLIWAELFKINAICLYCTGVHALTFILFALIVGRAAYSGVKAIPTTD